MALKALMLRKKITDANKEIEALRARDQEFEKREAELETSIEEASTEEEQGAVEEAVTAFEAEKAEHEELKESLEEKIRELTSELEAEEREQQIDPPSDDKKKEENVNMNTRSVIFGKMSYEQRTAMFQREDVQGWIREIRSAMAEKRAISNVGLTIPEVMLGLLRENIINYSKLYKHVNVRQISGTGRQLVMGTVPEAIWTDCCANLNELSLGFNDLEVDCYKVGGFFAICDANLEDSDIDLAAEILTSLGQAVGIALDKAILYGRNAATTQKMPQGIVSRLVQTEAPTGYPATARPWADLHTSNIISIAANKEGVDLFKAIVLASGAAKGKYARGEKVWCMNETTKTTLLAEGLSINAAGAIVSGMNGTMPVIGGVAEELGFLPDNVIIGGYFDLYTLSERAGKKFAQSEHVRFLQDQTVFKGTARYDGAPAIAEAFVAIGINGATPNATMTFASDTANPGE